MNVLNLILAVFLVGFFGCIIAVVLMAGVGAALFCGYALFVGAQKLWKLVR